MASRSPGFPWAARTAGAILSAHRDEEVTARWPFACLDSFDGRVRPRRTPPWPITMIGGGARCSAAQSRLDDDVVIGEVAGDAAGEQVAKTAVEGELQGDTEIHPTPGTHVQEFQKPVEAPTLAPDGR